MSEKTQNKKAAGIIAKIKSIKHIEIIIAAAAVIIMLIIYFSAFDQKPKQKEAAANTQTTADYCQSIREELEKAISRMKGAGDAKVIISWESSVEAVIAYVTNQNGTSISSSPQLIGNSGSTSPLILKYIYPKPLGVVVVCKGGENTKIKLDIINAVSTLLAIEPSKVIVYGS